MAGSRPLFERHVKGVAFAGLWGGLGFLPAFVVATATNPGSAPFELPDLPMVMAFSLFAAGVVAIGFGVGVFVLGVPLQAGLRAIRFDGLIPSMIVGGLLARAPGALVMAPDDTPAALDALAVGGLALGGALAARAYRKAIVSDA